MTMIRTMMIMRTLQIRMRREVKTVKIMKL